MPNQSKVPVIVMLAGNGKKYPSGPAQARRIGLGPGAERYALETWGLSFGNTGNDPWAYEFNKPGDGDAPVKCENAKRIAPMFSYPESREHWQRKWGLLRTYGLLQAGNWYLYDCGDGDYLGTDEPGSRGDKAYRAFDWGRAYQRVADALVDYPGLKPVVTMPKVPQCFSRGDATCIGHCRPFSDFGMDIVYAFPAHVIEMAIKKAGTTVALKGGINIAWRYVLDIPADAEVWAYWALYPDEGAWLYEGGFVDNYRASWMTERVPTPCDEPHLMQQWCRDRGVTGILHNANTKHLIDDKAQGTDAMTPALKAIVTGEAV